MTSFVRRSAAVVAAVIAALLVSVLPAAPALASGPGSVTVAVTEDGVPAPFLAVTLQGPQPGFGLTDATGTATITDLALGDYLLSVGASGTYQETATTLTLTAEAPSWTGTLDRQPWPSGDSTLAVAALDATTDAPVSGAPVWVSRLDGPGASHEGVTGPDGLFIVDALVAGTYSVSISSTPDYLGAAAEVILAAGTTLTETFRLLPADATIEGRVVDQGGTGLEGIFVSAELVGSGSFGMVTGLTDATGYYTLPDAAAGTWTVRVLPDAAWEGATVDVEVPGGSTATAPDLILAPRTSGTIAGLVASADGLPESSIGGFFDVCVTVLTPNGQPVPGASTTTGGDSFFSFSLPPGDYTVYFEDCDPDREPHRYQPIYLGGSPTLAGATVVNVETLTDVWLDTTTLQPLLAEPEPTTSPVAVRARDLEPSDRDLIDAPGMLRRGETAQVLVGAEHSGRWVSVWLHSRPTALGGWHQVAPDGTVEIEIPRLHPLGVHELVVQDSANAVIGWTDLRVRARITCLFPWLPQCS